MFRWSVLGTPRERRKIGVCNLYCTILEIYIPLVLLYQSVGACRTTIGSGEGVKRNTKNGILGHTRDYLSMFNLRISISFPQI